LALHSVGRMELGIITQQDDAAFEFTHRFKASEW
jgi:hypothetical protein